MGQDCNLENKRRRLEWDLVNELHSMFHVTWTLLNSTGNGFSLCHDLRAME